MTDEGTPVPHGLDRREFLKAVIVASVAAEVASLLDILKFGIAPEAGVSKFLTLQLVDANGNLVTASSLPQDSFTIILFPYPLENETNLLIRLPTSASGGVGPNNDIVAFSAICQHLGCVPPSLRYWPSGQVPPAVASTWASSAWKGFIYCACHGSIYDPSQGAKVLAPPAPRPLPQGVLAWDPKTDYLYIQKMVGPTIYGHADDLAGGAPLPSSTGTTVTEQG